MPLMPYQRVIQHQAGEQFNKARTKELFTRILNTLTPDNQELLSFEEVRRIVNPYGESYRGLQTVPIILIVGSEGRYRDFNKQFLPRKEYLRTRWTSIDRAHLSDIALPPIQLYELGGVYFVRDGNHRVSVARSLGAQSVDAEVVSLASEIRLTADMTRSRLLLAVIDYEAKRFEAATNFSVVVPEHTLRFTATGRYDEVMRHVHGHKYFINQVETIEIPFARALRSWFDTVFVQLIDVIREEKMVDRFPGRTEDDLYVWIVKHWHYLKQRYGETITAKHAALDYSRQYGVSFGERLKTSLLRLFKRRK